MDEAKRAPNFTFDETEKLKTCVQKWSAVVECKKTNSLSKTQKIAGWKKIEEDFNSDNAATFRSWAVLKKKWENLKKNCKKKYSDMKVYSKGTGGGQSKIVVFDAVEEQILEMIEPQAKGLSSVYDCDEEEDTVTSGVITEIVNVQESEGQKNLNHTIVEENSIVQTASDVSVSSDWASYTPKMLTAPVSRQLHVRKVGDTNCTPKKNKHIEDVKTEYLKIQKEQFIKEAELRMSFMKEEQALKIQLLEVQLEIEKKKLENIG